LAWKKGDLSRPFVHGRDERAGLAPSLLLGRWLEPEVASAALPAGVLESTVKAAVQVAAGASATGAASASVAALTKGMLKTMFLIRVQKAFGVALALGALVTGVGAITLQVSRGRDTDEPRAAGAKTLLTNGGYEDGNETPAVWKQGRDIEGVTYVWDKSVAYKGKASLGLTKTARRYFPIAEWTQEVPYTGGSTRLKVGAWVKTDQMTKAILDVQFLGKDDAWSHQWAAYIGDKPQAPPVTHGWKWYEGVVNIPEGTKTIRVAPQVYGPGKVRFDEVSADYTEEPATDATEKFKD
jgi:hypothetical protein